VEWLRSLKIPMVVSNQATERIIDLYTRAGFTISTVSAPRRISCSGDRDPALEMLATRNLD
jgi:DNA adenine methylase